MEGFNTKLALLDYVPVAAFGVAIALVGIRFGSVLFIIGALISLLAGIMKATWKLILGLKNKDVKWMNKYFVPMQSVGWLVMLLGVILNIRKINGKALLISITSLPQIIFFVLWIALLFTMSWYRKNKFKKDDAHTNWIAEIVNSCCQVSFLIAVILATK